MNESALRRRLGSKLTALVTTQLPHLLPLSIVQMIIDILPPGAECILSLINSVDVSFIKFAALDEILALFEHSLYFRFILLYFIKKELKKKKTCRHKKQHLRQHLRLFRGQNLYRYRTIYRINNIYNTRK